MLELTLVMILTDLGCDFGGEYEIDVVYAAEEPTCASDGATRRTATKTAFIVLP